MNPFSSIIIQPPELLSRDVDSIRIVQYSGDQDVSIKVCPNGLPGLLFQHSEGHSAVRRILMKSGAVTEPIPTLYLYGQITELSVMQFCSGPYLSIQVVLKPHALQSIFEVDASTLTNDFMDYTHLSLSELNDRLLRTDGYEDCVELLLDLMLSRLKQADQRDSLMEEGLSLIDQDVRAVSVQSLLGRLHLSERQFQKRFMRTVGMTPQLYIRIKRFNGAVRLMDTGSYDKLSDVAHALHFHDQSHFIRDMKQFSGITPTSISQKANSFHSDLVGSSYIV